jgi:hypothetical protein
VGSRYGVDTVSKRIAAWIDPRVSFGIGKLFLVNSVLSFEGEG